MTVTVTNSATNGEWLRISGTIQEVLDELADQKLGSQNVTEFDDDGTDAVAVACRFTN